jgi:hypothetical protein
VVDLFTLFRLVAAEGGAAAVTQRDGWRALSNDKAWPPAFAKAASGEGLVSAWRGSP